ncbi:MAG: pteridine reductase [Gammaproteobacteria bacterium]|nr:pteridine reductase [Gammaproteobacteria bacterium]
MTASPVALITGAAARIGAATATLLHENGYRIIIHYNNSVENANALANSLNNKREDSARILEANLMDSKAVSALADRSIAAWGQLDLLVNNASAFYPTPLETITEEQWQELFASNAMAPLLLARSTSDMLRQQQGCIINISDTHVRRGLKNHSIYIMAKSALEGMTRTMARDLAPEVRVNAIAPGAILWAENGNDLSHEMKAAIIDGISLKRMGEPLDIANAVLFLAGNASYITGQVLHVDGGR